MTEGSAPCGLVPCEKTTLQRVCNQSATNLILSIFLFYIQVQCILAGWSVDPAVQSAAFVTHPLMERVMALMLGHDW
jgi:hypothetical protein